jgi:hypothetical protein
MKGMNSMHEKSSLVHITQAYKISALTPLVLTRLHAHTYIHIHSINPVSARNLQLDVEQGT